MANGMIRGGRALVAASIIFLCPLETTLQASATPTPNLPINALSVPLHLQETNYTCGPGALLPILRYWQKFQGTEADLYPLLNPSPEYGTHPEKLVEVAEKFLLTAEHKTSLTLSDLRAYLAAGKTVIIDLQAWAGDPNSAPVEHPIDWKNRWEDGHYIVLVGLDSHFLYAMDPSAEGGYGYFPLTELMDRWHDYEMEDGKRVDYYQSAVILSGSQPWGRAPETTRLVRIN